MEESIRLVPGLDEAVTIELTLLRGDLKALFGHLCSRNDFLVSNC